MTLRAAAIGAALAALLLTACGQKGPLYLPEDADTAPEAGTASSAETASSEETALSADEPQVD